MGASREATHSSGPMEDYQQRHEHLVTQVTSSSLQLAAAENSEATDRCRWATHSRWTTRWKQAIGHIFAQCQHFATEHFLEASIGWRRNQARSTHWKDSHDV